MHVFDGSTIEDESPHVLAETAADVEELGAGFDAGENFVVGGRLAYGKVEEAETACVACELELDLEFEVGAGQESWGWMMGRMDERLK